jgi:hypothetical protein
MLQNLLFLKDNSKINIELVLRPILASINKNTKQKLK